MLIGFKRGVVRFLIRDFLCLNHGPFIFFGGRDFKGDLQWWRFGLRERLAYPFGKDHCQQNYQCAMDQAGEEQQERKTPAPLRSADLLSIPKADVAKGIHASAGEWESFFVAPCLDVFPLSFFFGSGRRPILAR